MTASGYWTGVGRTPKTFSALILLCTIPATMLIVTQSEHLIRLLFERGAFTARDTRQVG
jgi:peptidoglycan biosynthesis protein MviN/MurJ (putative lipid II flippase)